DAFHYFGLGAHETTVEQRDVDPGGDIRIPEDKKDESAKPEPLFRLNSPGLWALISILGIGAFNLMGPKHSAGFALFAAAGMVAITLMVVAFALPQINWRDLKLGRLNHPPLEMWQAFVAIVLALSGVEAIANLTGVMK